MKGGPGSIRSRAHPSPLLEVLWRAVFKPSAQMGLGNDDMKGERGANWAHGCHPGQRDARPLFHSWLRVEGEYV
jgi:hypothetical protein